MSWIKSALGFAASAYVQDVILRPRQVAKLARAYCDRTGKPLLNVGAGTETTSLRALLVGPTLWGDVNIDKAGPRIPHGPGVVSYGDAYDLREWPDKHFGAIVASHVLEHLEHPEHALREWRRVADKVFVIVPSWWAPHTWLHPGHRWFIDPSLQVAAPLWTSRNRTHLLPVSDRRYGSREWTNPQPANSSQPSPQQPAANQLSPTPVSPDTESSASVSVLTVVSKSGSPRG